MATHRGCLGLLSRLVAAGLLAGCCAKQPAKPKPAAPPEKVEQPALPQPAAKPQAPVFVDPDELDLDVQVEDTTTPAAGARTDEDDLKVE